MKGFCLFDNFIDFLKEKWTKWLKGEAELISSLNLPRSNWIGFDVIDTMEKEGLV